MFRYKYIGKTEIELQGIGIIRPNSIVISNTYLNHPLLEPYFEEEKTTNIKEEIPIKKTNKKRKS